MMTSHRTRAITQYTFLLITCILHTHTVSSGHSESANGVNRDGGRFIDNHQIFVNMKDLSPLVCPTPV